MNINMVKFVERGYGKEYIRERLMPKKDLKEVQTGLPEFQTTKWGTSLSIVK